MYITYRNSQLRCWMLKNCKTNQINHKGFVNEGAQVNENKHISLSPQLQFPFGWLSILRQRSFMSKPDNIFIVS